MSNDPKDAVVDVSKLTKGHTNPASGGNSASTTHGSNNSSLITPCNESANLIGNEHFSQNSNIKEKKDN